MAKTKVTCPCCGEPAERIEREGKQYVLCEAEDTVYEIKATGARFAKRGVLDEILKRLDALEGKGEPETEPKPDDGDNPDDDDDDGGLEIVFGEGE